MDVRVMDYKRDVKNTRKGYFTLYVDGLLVKKCVAHKSAPSVNHPDGKTWFAPPAVQVEGRYENIVCCASPALNDQLQQIAGKQLQPYLEKE